MELVVKLVKYVGKNYFADRFSLPLTIQYGAYIMMEIQILMYVGEVCFRQQACFTNFLHQHCNSLDRELKIVRWENSNRY